MRAKYNAWVDIDVSLKDRRLDIHQEIVQGWRTLCTSKDSKIFPLFVLMPHTCIRAHVSDTEAFHQSGKMLRGSHYA